MAFCVNMDEIIVIASGGRLGDTGFFRQRAACMKKRLLVACDGGARHLTALGLQPDVLIGDMDSVDAGEFAAYERRGVKIIRHPADKDFTDTQLALDYALSLKPRAVEIWGAQGGRIDHTLANVYLLLCAKDAGIRASLVDEFTDVSIAGDETIIDEARGCVVSLLALSPVVEGITLEGFEYPLAGEKLIIAESRGISNTITAPVASVRVQSGNLLIVRYRRPGVFPEAV